MNVFVKAAAGVLVALILHLILTRQGKDFSVLLTVAVCCMMAAAAMEHLEPVIAFFEKLQTLGQLDSSMMTIILRAVGIGLLAEIVGLVCSDAGNAALGKTLQILASAVILWMSVPLFTSLIELVEEILVSV